ncbi:MAG: FtsX-like permease family protein [Gammaproteobacteria bacterium]|nr:FtsX-like permease family protein [Gammaproteobacteria bacterium]
MGLGPMMSSLMRSKTGPLLVALQIAVTLAIVINSLFIVVQRVERINRDAGTDVDNVIVTYVRGFGEGFDVVDSITNDINLLKSIPGVLAATVSNHVPLSGSGSGTGLRTVPDETIKPVETARYVWSEEGLDALGIELSRGRNFFPEEVNYILPDSDPGAPPSILVTQDLADGLFGEEDALGKTVYWGSMEPSTIVGIIGHMHGSWVSWDKLANVVIQPGKPAYTTNKYLIRVEPGMRDELMPIIEQKLGESNRQRVVKSVRSLEELAARSYRRDRGMAIILSVVITLLIGLTALVIVGLASFHVTQRTKQIGTRRALGARRGDIIREFMLENWLITTAGAVLGVVLTVAVAYWLEVSFELTRLDWRYLPPGIVILWVLSTLAVIEPARRAASVPPAVATRSV